MHTAYGAGAVQPSLFRPAERSVHRAWLRSGTSAELRTYPCCILPTQGGVTCTPSARAPCPSSRPDERCSRRPTCEPIRDPLWSTPHASCVVRVTNPRACTGQQRGSPRGSPRGARCRGDATGVGPDRRPDAGDWPLQGRSPPPWYHCLGRAAPPRHKIRHAARLPSLTPSNAYLLSLTGESSRCATDVPVLLGDPHELDRTDGC